jgi:3',5'-cyclic-AMP phosphodiesterase
MTPMNADLRLLQISDPHLFADPRGALRGAVTLECLERVLAHATQRRRNIDAVLCTGDIVNDDPGGYAHFARVLGALGKPVYCVPGNHDAADQLRSALAHPPFQICGQADLGNWRLVLLDSSVPGRTSGRLAPSELQRLREALESSERHVMVCVHHQPVNLASRWLDALGIQNAEQLFEVLDEYGHGRVRLLCFGHVHQRFDERHRGVRLLATPSTCVQFQPLASDFALDTRPPAYRQLTLHADGTVDTEVVWVEPAVVLPAVAGTRG